MERKAVSQRASRPFSVPQLSMKRGPRQPLVSVLDRIEKERREVQEGKNAVDQINGRLATEEASSRAVVTKSTPSVCALDTTILDGGRIREPPTPPKAPFYPVSKTIRLSLSLLVLENPLSLSLFLQGVGVSYQELNCSKRTFIFFLFPLPTSFSPP